MELGADRAVSNINGKTALVLAEESLDKQLQKQGPQKKRKPAEKGSLLDRLQATVDFLYERDGGRKNGDDAGK